MTQRMCVLGECMLEMSATLPTGESVGPASLSFGGETLNTSIYYARLGGQVDYLSALGDDPLSAWMLENWRAEGVGCDHVVLDANGVPGLYMIQLDEQGERSFVYWRENSPARGLLQSRDAVMKVLEQVSGYDMLYLSGITLSLMTAESRAKLFEFAPGFRKNGGMIAFDSNYRPSQWASKTQSQLVYGQMYRCTDIALSTADDEYLLFDESSAEEIVTRLADWGVAELALKDGAGDCLLHIDGKVVNVPTSPVAVVDTTAAGDSFNGAYLASRNSGLEPIAAARNGHALAGVVIGHRGAIIARALMPKISVA